MRAMRYVGVALLALGTAFAATATAKDAKDEGTTKEVAGGAHLRWSRTYAGAMAEAKARGCVVFATFHEDG
jgi:hypothetical protein